MLFYFADRCLLFGEASVKYAFVNLQLDLLDDFRLRLTQLLEDDNVSTWPLPQRHFAILNTVNYLLVVLNEWKNLPVSLYSYMYVLNNQFCFSFLLN